MSQQPNNNIRPLLLEILVTEKYFINLVHQSIKFLHRILTLYTPKKDETSVNLQQHQQHLSPHEIQHFSSLLHHLDKFQHSTRDMKELCENDNFQNNNSEYSNVQLGDQILTIMQAQQLNDHYWNAFFYCCFLYMPWQEVFQHVQTKLNDFQVLTQQFQDNDDYEWNFSVKPMLCSVVCFVSRIPRYVLMLKQLMKEAQDEFPSNLISKLEQVLQRFQQCAIMDTLYFSLFDKLQDVEIGPMCCIEKVYLGVNFTFQIRRVSNVNSCEELFHKQHVENGVMALTRTGYLLFFEPNISIHEDPTMSPSGPPLESFPLKNSSQVFELVNQEFSKHYETYHLVKSFHFVNFHEKKNIFLVSLLLKSESKSIQLFDENVAQYETSSIDFEFQEEEMFNKLWNRMIQMRSAFAQQIPGLKSALKNNSMSDIHWTHNK